MKYVTAPTPAKMNRATTGVPDATESAFALLVDVDTDDAEPNDVPVEQAVLGCPDFLAWLIWRTRSRRRRPVVWDSGSNFVGMRKG